ncbi:thioredoxin family protein [Pedobacter frigoris]|uniref:Thioredoxin family protein n=1 Tax=Pedobacter frigoris TaxID=2571272 RepID=A0A4U1CM68_9SPHI|nr:thioredoxin family protein [Pedobacter frigoris]TKC07616.1 thioredoxin family protein [Pedobacter frigoris]
MINYSNIFDNDGISYSAYRDLIDKLLSEGKTTGPDDSEAMLHYTKMNIQRMSRVDKTLELQESLINVLTDVKNKHLFLVVTEGWCGDAAQIVPVFNKIVIDFSDKFDLRFVLRDKNLPLIDAHLTNGGRAIPVLLILNEEGALLDSWGPRPAVLQELLAQWKKETTDMMEIAEKLHGWYAKDKTYTTQRELTKLLRKLK